MSTLRLPTSEGGRWSWKVDNDCGTLYKHMYVAGTAVIYDGFTISM